MGLYREQGIVLRTYKLGETDRILNLLTQGQGKVRAVAKGVRKPGSRFGGRLEPLSHVDLQLYEGRNLDVVTQAELITSFATVRDDFALSACGSAMAEGADRVAPERERSNSLFLLLLDGLRALARRPQHPAAVLDAYLLRLASATGWHPYVDACAACGTPGEHRVFSIAMGGALCPRCAPQGAQPLDAGILDLLRMLGSDDWQAVGARAPQPRVSRAASALIQSYLAYHLGNPLKATDVVPR